MDYSEGLQPLHRPCNAIPRPNAQGLAQSVRGPVARMLRYCLVHHNQNTSKYKSCDAFAILWVAVTNDPRTSNLRLWFPPPPICQAAPPLRFSGMGISIPQRSTPACLFQRSQAFDCVTESKSLQATPAVVPPQISENSPTNRFGPLGNSSLEHSTRECTTGDS